VPALREALSLGADRARLLVPDAAAVTADSAAAALALLLRNGPRFDLVLGGSGTAGGDEGLTARLTAEFLGVPHVGTAATLAVRSSDGEADVLLAGSDGSVRIRELPAAVNIEAGLALRPFTSEGYLTALSRVVEIERWPRKVEARAVTFLEGAKSTEGAATGPAGPLSAAEAAGRVLDVLGLRGEATAHVTPFAGTVADVPALASLAGVSTAVLATQDDGRLAATAGSVLRAARLLGDLEGLDLHVLLLTSPDEEVQRRAVAHLRTLFHGDVVLLALPEAAGPVEVRNRLLRACWPAEGPQPRMIVGESWAESAFVALAARSGPGAMAAERVRRVAFEGDHVLLETGRARGKLRVLQSVESGRESTCWVTLAAEAEISDNRSALMSRLKPFSAGALQEGHVQRWTPALDRVRGSADMQRLLQEVKTAAGVDNLSEAEFIIDVGFGVGNRDGYEAVIDPLEKTLRVLGVRNLVIGGSRKVTEELHLLPADRQIGQSGVSVSPRLLLAIGISGAPQHLNYIGPGAVIVAFNRDPEAPLMTLNRRQARPRVFPVVGDLFETVPALIEALRRERGGEARAAEAPAEALARS
jgi:electron transfer flavoprotein alpha subunit